MMLTVALVSGDFVTLTFNCLDAKSHNRPFSIDVDVSRHDYAVSNASPSLPQSRLAPVVDALNDSRDFAPFVRAVRAAFVDSLGLSGIAERRKAGVADRREEV